MFRLLRALVFIRREHGWWGVRRELIARLRYRRPSAQVELDEHGRVVGVTDLRKQ